MYGVFDAHSLSVAVLERTCPLLASPFTTDIEPDAAYSQKINLNFKVRCPLHSFSLWTCYRCAVMATRPFLYRSRQLGTPHRPRALHRRAAQDSEPARTCLPSSSSSTDSGSAVACPWARERRAFSSPRRLDASPLGHLLERRALARVHLHSISRTEDVYQEPRTEEKVRALQWAEGNDGGVGGCEGHGRRRVLGLPGGKRKVG